jgi:hypothetical protein
MNCARNKRNKIQTKKMKVALKKKATTKSRKRATVRGGSSKDNELAAASAQMYSKESVPKPSGRQFNVRL